MLAQLRAKPGGAQIRLQTGDFKHVVSDQRFSLIYVVFNTLFALRTVEYLFPLTADDTLKGVVFRDYGTVEETVALRSENFRVAPGFGLRISIPALGPAPLALDVAFPVAYADTDERRVFSFFFGFSRM